MSAATAAEWVASSWSITSPLAATLTLAVVSVLAVVALQIHKRYLRPLFPVTVECWFCSRKCKVEYDRKNAFFCAYTDCGQYNGFTKDGDYNWRDPDMSASDGGGAAVSRESNNGLCRNCNLNQELKIRQMSKFVPQKAGNEDEEMERYKRHLERAYKLCRKCEAFLHQKLGEQSSWLKPKLLTFRLEKNRQTDLKSTMLVKETAFRRNLRSTGSFVVRAAVLAAGVASCYHRSKQTETALGALSASLLFNLMGGATFTLCEVLSLFTWAALAALSLVTKAGLVAAANDSAIQVGTAACVLFSAAAFALQKSPTSSRRVPPKNPRQEPAYDSSPKYFEDSTDEEIEHCEQTLKDDQRNSSNASQKTSVLDEQLLSFPEQEFHLGTDTGSQLGSTANPFFAGRGSFCSKTPSVASFSSFSALRPPSVLQEPLRPRSRTDEGSDNSRCDISTLSLTDGSSGASGHARPASVLGSVLGSKRANGSFSTRTYNAVNVSGINFGDAPPARRRRGPVLKPAKPLKNWVAGGYWQAAPNSSAAEAVAAAEREEQLSQSSSQTSGFISYSRCQNAIFGPATARPPSMLGGPQFLQHSSRSCSRAGSRSSSDSSLERLTQGAFDSLKPRAESSPIDGQQKKKKGSSLLEKRIVLDCSVSSVLLVVSIVANFALCAYFLLTA